jgi:hypothetical protein
MLEPTALQGASITQAVAYHFHFASGEWAIFTLNEATREFLIQFERDLYRYRWQASALGGRTLLEFIADADSEDLADKLQLGAHRQNLELVLDRKATLAAVRKAIRDALKERACTEGQAWKLWHLADEWKRRHFRIQACPGDLEQLLNPSWNHLRWKLAPSLAMLDQLLPLFCTWLRENALSHAQRTSCAI